MARLAGDLVSHPPASQQEELGVVQRVDLLEVLPLVHQLVHGQPLPAPWVPLLAEAHVPWRRQQPNPQWLPQARWAALWVQRLHARRMLQAVVPNGSPPGPRL